MIKIEKVVIDVLVTKDPENICAKCCRTLSAIEKLVEALKNYKDRIEINHENIMSERIVERYGELRAPTIIVNNSIFSEGHVPVIKKLCRTILSLME